MHLDSEICLCYKATKRICPTMISKRKSEKYYCRSITSVIFLFANCAWISLTLKSLRQLQEIATETNSSSEPTSHCQCFVVSQKSVYLYTLIKNSSHLLAIQIQ